jgi:hypothetical protein
MNRKHFLPVMLLTPCLCAAVSAFAQTVVVYKHVDESGRVTYSNQPMKGASVVELSPLTVLPKSQAAQTNASAPTKLSVANTTPSWPTSPAASAPTEAMNASPIDAKPQPTAQNDQALEPRAAADTKQEQRVAASSAADVSRQISPPAVAVVTTKPPQREVLNARSPMNSGMTVAMLAQQRREDVRRRILEGEIEAESQLKAEAEADLQRVQAKSAAMRSLSAAITADERALAGKGPLSDDLLATKSVVMRHFERVRELQDQVAMHEENLAELKSQLRTPPPQRTALKSVQLKPTATAARLDTSKLR